MSGLFIKIALNEIFIDNRRYFFMHFLRKEDPKYEGENHTTTKQNNPNYRRCWIYWFQLSLGTCENTVTNTYRWH